MEYQHDDYSNPLGRSGISRHKTIVRIAAVAIAALFASVLPAPAQGADLLVSSEATDQVLRYDGTTGAFLGVFASGNGMSMPEGLAFGPDGNLYVANINSDRILRFNGSTGAFIDVFVPPASGIAQPVGLLFRAGELYVGERTSASIKRYDAITGAALGTFASGGLSAPDAFVFGPDGDLHVSSRGSNAVLRFDGTTGAAKGTFASGGGLSEPEVPLFSNDGNLYVVSRGSNSILRYNGTTGTFIDTFASAGLGESFGMARGSDQNLYVTNVNSASVTRHDGTSGALLGTFVAGGSGGLSVPTFLLFMPGPLGDICTHGSQCSSGFCADGVCCDTACGAGECDACAVAAGAVTNGTCTLLSNVACDDGNACTQNDSCIAGACQSGASLVCTALDECHDAGACDPIGGVCTNPLKPDGSACTGGTCISGTCKEGVTSTGTGAGGGGTSTSSGDAGNNDPHVISGCGCEMAGPGADGAPWLALGLLMMWRRRSRRSMTSSPM